MTARSLVAFFSLAALQNAVGAPPAQFREKIEALVADHPGGVAAAWVDSQGTTFVEAGHWDGPSSPRVTADTLFELGSVTKVFTALLLAESERLGKVRGNDSAAKYLLPTSDPDQASLGKISLYSLSTHTSGLRRLSANLGDGDGKGDPYANYDRPLLVDALRAEGRVAPTGRAVVYSNFGAAVLGEALGAAWATTYPKAVRERVLEPLNMKATIMGLAGSPPPANLPPGHFEGKTVPNWTFQAYAAAGGLRSSARDMARFLSACLAPKAGPLAQAFASAARPQRKNPDSGGYIGLGWFITDAGTVWHGGITGGSTALLAYSPKTRAGVVILSNDDVLSQRLGLQLLGDELPQRQRENVPDASQYAGTYPLSSQYTMEITAKDGTLRGRVVGQPEFVLRTVGPDRFAIVGAPSEISFERDVAGGVSALTLHELGQAQRGMRSE